MIIWDPDTDDKKAFVRIRAVADPLWMSTDGKKYRPVKNTSRHDVYKAMWEIKNIIIQNEAYHFIKNAEAMQQEAERLRHLGDADYGEDIQHVGYSQEACGYEK